MTNQKTGNHNDRVAIPGVHLELDTCLKLPTARR